MPMMLGLGRFVAKRLPADAHDAGPVMPVMGPALGRFAAKRLPADAHDAGPVAGCVESAAGDAHDAGPEPGLP